MSKHKAYFESWDNGAYFKNPKYVVTHASGGLFYQILINILMILKNHLY